MISTYPAVLGFHHFLAWSYQEQGRFRDALNELNLTRRTDTPALMADLGCIYAMIGNRAAALELIGKLHAMSSRTYVPPY
jgi:hypothetical protein